MPATATIPAPLEADLSASGARSRFVDVPFGRLHALDFGGSGRDVLVLPGITSPAVTWTFAVRALQGAGRFVVADLRGRGLSDAPPDGSYSLEAYAGDAATLVHGLALDRPVLLGHSLGARIAAALAVREPDLVGPAVLVDPPLSGPARAPYPTSLDAFLGQLREARAGTTPEAVAAHWPAWPEPELGLRARWLPTCDERAVAETHRGFESEDFLPLWDRVDDRAVLVRGGTSPVVDDAGAAELAARRADLEIVTVAGTGHMIPWDDLDAFEAAVRPLLDRFASDGGEP